MEKVKYIPGDLVMTDGAPIGAKKGVAYIITRSEPNRTHTFTDGTVNKGTVALDAVTEEDKEHFFETSTWVKHIVPIPLTSAILETNGWEKTTIIDDHLHRVFYMNIEKGVDLWFNYETKMFDVEIDDTIIRENIKFAHQLQHLLFGLGIDSSLKV